ncbi:MAG: FtsW/RodA/SpoVE family cell cycle protein, partial [Actinomycetota bacterium]
TLGTETFAGALTLHAGGGAFITAACLQKLGRPALLAATLPAEPFRDPVRSRIDDAGLDGGLSGAGLFDGPQTQLGYLPDQHTDFIFAAVAEELGFLGALTVLVLQATVLGLILMVGLGCRDRFGRLLCAGVFAMIAFQVIQNVAMNLRLLPITGISLPFVSYGGSSMVTLLVAIGLVQSVARHRGPLRPGAVARAGR